MEALQCHGDNMQQTRADKLHSEASALEDL